MEDKEDKTSHWQIDVGKNCGLLFAILKKIEKKGKFFPNNQSFNQSITISQLSTVQVLLLWKKTKHPALSLAFSHIYIA